MKPSKAAHPSALVTLLASGLFFSVAAFMPSNAGAVSNDLVVSQVYGGGGNTGATYTNDFIEIFNRGTSTIDVTGWSVQYGSSGGTTWSSTALSGSIAPGGYYLVQEAAGAGGTTALPTPDATGSIAMSATAGKVALVNSAVPLSGACPSDASIVDLVGYGAANCAEGSPTSTLTNLTAAVRAFEGCAETDDNAVDFAVAAPTPRNSVSATHSCQYTLDVALDPGVSGSVTKSPDQAGYLHGESVELTATGNSFYHFVSWSGDASGSTNPLTVFMDGNKSITAHFALNQRAHPVVISQVYGGGGNTGATYRFDFIELFNTGLSPVDITGWTVQYASTGGSLWLPTTLVGVIQPGRYYLIQEAQGAGGTDDLPLPDAIGATPLGSTTGKVALVSSMSLLSTLCPTGGNIEDFVGYGAADCSEGSPSPAADNAIAVLRNEAGCIDTNDNAADFSAGLVHPRNSSTPLNLCSFWVSVADDPTTEFGLGALFPNPARGALRVEFALPRATDLNLDVLDVQGRRVATLAEGYSPAGRHEVIWNGMAAGGPARSGIYFIRMRAAGRTFSRSVIVTR